jgi:hypothetical protein
MHFSVWRPTSVPFALCLGSHARTAVPDGGHRFSAVEPGAGGEGLVEPVRPQRLADLGSSVLLRARGARAPLYGVSHALGQARRPRATCWLGGEASSSS